MPAMPPKLLRRLEWAAFGAGAALFGMLGMSCAIVVAIGEPPAGWLGNHPGNVGYHGAAGGDFTFAVLGDTQKGVTGTRRMLARLRGEKPILYIHTGDLVSHNDAGHYRLARWLMLRAGLEAPCFVVPGNHDVKGNPHLFEKNIGPREIAFARGRVRFVTVDNSEGQPPDRAALEKRLRAAGESPIVLFMHVPPWDTKSDALAPRGPGYDDTLALIRKYRVRYVFSGHVHVYKRLEDGGTVYIANGVGGDSDRWQYDQRVCATLLEVKGTQIADRLVWLPPSVGLWDNVVHLALGHVREAYARHPVWLGGATAVLFAAWIWVTARRWKKR